MYNPAGILMLKLLQTFVDIALWRKGPQDLPASRFLAILVLVAYVGANLVQVQLLNLRPRTAAVVVVVDVTMMIGWLWAVLAFFGRSQRFVQTFTAVLGVAVLLAALDLVVHASAGIDGNGRGPAGRVAESAVLRHRPDHGPHLHARTRSWIADGHGADRCHRLFDRRRSPGHGDAIAGPGSFPDLKGCR